MKFVTLVLVLLFALCAIPVLAQDTHLYEDPDGHFSVPIPQGWQDESTAKFEHFVAADGTAASILEIESTDVEIGTQAILISFIPDLVGTAPAQHDVETLGNSTWTVNVYTLASNRIVLLATQWRDGTTYGLLFDVPGQDALAANQEQIVHVLTHFSIGKRVDLTNVKPHSFTKEMLAELRAYIKNSSEILHVPGLSIGIVQNGEVVYTDGFGMTEADGGQPVTADTLFMIGSVAKSMTTMMMGTLVDEGILDWDRPVTDILPSFALSDPAATAQIRVRDLVNMSSGVPRYDVITSIANFTPQELIASLANIPMVAAPGEMYNYSNQMVAAGGYISALASGSPIDGLYDGYVNLIQKRVFDPIGMVTSTFDFDTAIANPNHALPYGYNPPTHEYIPVLLSSERSAVQIAPAGAVWSNASDMVRYLQTELGGGLSPGGKRVISEATLGMTQSVEIAPVGPFAGYGMGWILDSYNGLPMIFHGGNTAGFSSDMAFLPSANLGVVILTDGADANVFTEALRQYVFELAFGLEHGAAERLASTSETQEEPQAIPSTSAIDPQTVAPYLGKYEDGAALEMRGDELWIIGAFVQTPLYPANEPGHYTSNGAYSALDVQLAKSGDQLTLEINFPQNPTLSLDKIE